MPRTFLDVLFMGIEKAQPFRSRYTQESELLRFFQGLPETIFQRVFTGLGAWPIDGHKTGKPPGNDGIYSHGYQGKDFKSGDTIAQVVPE